VVAVYIDKQHFSFAADGARNTAPERFECVAKRFGVARSTIWRWVQQGLFPKPYQLGPSTTRWQEKDILAFEARAAGR
jgi:prophage regulatory protein